MREIPVYKFFKHKYGPELLVDVVDMARMGPGIHRTPTYIQTFFALMLVTEDQQWVEVNGRGMTVRPGMAICARPSEVWTWQEDAHIDVLSLGFEEDFLLSFFNDPHFLDRFPWLSANRRSPFLLFSDDLYQRTLTLLKEMRDEINRGPDIDQHILRAMLYEALMLFSRATMIGATVTTTRQQFFGDMTDVGNSRYADEFVRLVSKHYATEHSTEFYASRLCITPNYLNKVVRQSLGKSAKQYILNRILQEAERLLRYTSLPVQDIASRLGFDTATYFVRFFSKHEGMSPLQYREQAKSSEK